MYEFIVNPSSGCGMAQYIWRKLDLYLKKVNTEYHAYITKQSGDARLFARQITGRHQEQKVIVVVGGDGTVNEVIDGLDLRCPIVLAYIPVGLHSELAVRLKLPRNPKVCLKKILAPSRYCLLDYGVLTYGKEEIKHRRFLTSSGIGLDAAVCHNVQHSSLKNILRTIRMEKWIYLLSGCRQFLHAIPAEGYLVLDGEQRVEFSHAYSISAYIIPSPPQPMKAQQRKTESSRQLCLCLASSMDKQKVFPVLWKRYGSKMKTHRKIRHYQCKEVVIHMEHPMAVHADGESCLTQNDLQIRYVERKIKMVI